MDDSIFEDMNDNLLGAIVRYRNHASIFAIMKFCNSKSHFSSKNVQKQGILKEINNLINNEAPQNTNISTKEKKEN